MNDIKKLKYYNIGESIWRSGYDFSKSGQGRPLWGDGIQAEAWLKRGQLVSVAETAGCYLKPFIFSSLVT